MQRMQTLPAKSKAQRRAVAIAEHHPEKLRKKNRGLLKMTKKQLHDYASTKEKGLPKHTKKKQRTKSRKTSKKK